MSPIARMTPTNLERDTSLKLLNEAAFRQGTLVKAWLVKEESTTITGDLRYTYEDTPVEFYAVLDTQPKIKLLKHLGWFREDDSIQPIILNVPLKVWYLDDEGQPIQVLEELFWRRGTIIEFTYDLNPDNSNKFKVHDISVDPIAFVYYSNLVPFRDTVPAKTTIGQGSFVEPDKSFTVHTLDHVIDAVHVVNSLGHDSIDDLRDNSSFQASIEQKLPLYSSFWYRGKVSFPTGVEDYSWFQIKHSKNNYFSLAHPSGINHSQSWFLTGLTITYSTVSCKRIRHFEQHLEHDKEGFDGYSPVSISLFANGKSHLLTTFTPETSVVSHQNLEDYSRTESFTFDIESEIDFFSIRPSDHLFVSSISFSYSHRIPILKTPKRPYEFNLILSDSKLLRKNRDSFTQWVQHFSLFGGNGLQEQEEYYTVADANRIFDQVTSGKSVPLSISTNLDWIYANIWLGDKDVVIKSHHLLFNTPFSKILNLSITQSPPSKPLKQTAGDRPDADSYQEINQNTFIKIN